MIATLVVVAAVTWLIAVVALAGTTQLHGVAEAFAWCRDSVRRHTGVPNPIALVAFGVLGGALASVARARRVQRQVRAPRGEGGLVVLESEVPIAFALPGNPGQIVVSSGMLGALGSDEQQVLIAHEQAHLDLRHHRYVRTVELAAAALPLLHPLVLRVRFATERWADEAAALRVGDRALVARALAHAAFAEARPRPGLSGMSDSGVVERVEAMLAAPPVRSRSTELIAVAVLAACAAGIVGSAVQVHHLVVGALHLCFW